MYLFAIGADKSLEFCNFAAHFVTLKQKAMRIILSFSKTFFEFSVIRDQEREVEKKDERMISATVENENKDDRLFSTTVKGEIERRRGTVSNSTIKNEQTAYRSFLKFTGEDIKLCDLTPEKMKEYEKELEEHIIPNTAAAYMRSLRSVLNRLGLDGKTIFSLVRTAKVKAEKTAIQAEDVKKISELDLKKGSWLQIVRDLFIFSIMAMGIPFIDLIHLRKSNIKNSYIIYHRRKTKRQAKVHIEPCLQEIIDRFYSEDSKYIFPLLAADNNNDRAYHSLLARYNRALAKIAGMAGINTKITSYTARHTWASIAYRIGGSLGAISKALTHKSPVTTQNYLKELDDRDVFEVNKLVLKEIWTQISTF